VLKVIFDLIIKYSRTLMIKQIMSQCVKVPF